MISPTPPVNSSTSLPTRSKYGSLDQGNDPNHLALPLPAKTIAKLKTPIATVKSIEQRYSSFGGRRTQAETAGKTEVAKKGASLAGSVTDQAASFFAQEGRRGVIP